MRGPFSIASATAALVLAGISGSAAQKTAVPASVFDDLRRYAAFASAAYSDECAVPPFGSTVERYFDVASTSTQATLFRDAARSELVLSFRGTENDDEIDWDTNAKVTLDPCVAPGISCSNCTCHQGYLAQYNSIAAELKTDIRTRLDAQPGYKLVVTGHSMGGALTSLAAASLKGQGLPLKAYTYGQPRTGNQAFADHVDSLFPPSSATASAGLPRRRRSSGGPAMYRVTHDNDGVPQLYPRSLGYVHHSTEFWQADDPAAAATTYRCSGGQEPSDCNQSRPGYGVGVGGIGINAAHLVYFGISIGNPNITQAACQGIN